MKTGTEGWRLALGAVPLLALTSALLASPSEADAPSICTFTSAAITYDEKHPGQTLTFSWNNATGAIQNDGTECSPAGAAAGGTAYWDDLRAGVKRVQCGLSSVPGNVTPGFSTSANNTSSLYLLLANGAEIRGIIHAGGAQSAKPILFSGAYYGANSYLLTGYGTVTCTP